MRRAHESQDGRPQRDCTVTSQHVVERSQPGWVAAVGAGRGAGRTTVPTRAPQTAVCGLRSQGGHPHAQGWSPAAAHLGVGSDSTGKSEKGGASSAFALTARRAGGRHVAWAGLWGDAPAASTPNARVSAVGRSSVTSGRAQTAPISETGVLSSLALAPDRAPGWRSICGWGVAGRGSRANKTKSGPLKVLKMCSTASGWSKTALLCPGGRFGVVSVFLGFCSNGKKTSSLISMGLVQSRLGV